MEFHSEQLAKHCRICGNRLCKAKSRAAVYLCTKFQEDLLAYFEINVRQDMEHIHPPKFCSRCYAAKTTAAKAVADRVPYKHAIIPMEWKPHEEEGCTVR